MRVRLKGLKQVTRRLADGTSATYWYAWPGGPRLPGRPGTAEFLAAYTAAVAERRSQGQGETLRALVSLYRSKPEYTRLAASTRAEWARWLDRIALHPIGELTWAMLEDRRARADLIDWRDEYADRPRAADYGMQVLSRVLAVALDRGLLSVNLAAGVTALYASDRADQVWTDDEVARFAIMAPSPEVAFIVELACMTGLRFSDLRRLSWSHVGRLAIVIPTGKSRGRKTATAPLTAESRALLAEIAAHQAARHATLAAAAARKGRPPPPTPPTPLTVLSTTRGAPWSAGGAEHMVIAAKAAAGIDRHLHDARGTFATRLRRAGLKASEIADVLGWEEDRVERLLARYVDRDAIVMALAERLSGNDS